MKKFVYLMHRLLLLEHLNVHRSVNISKVTSERNMASHMACAIFFRKTKRKASLLKTFISLVPEEKVYL